MMIQIWVEVGSSISVTLPVQPFACSALFGLAVEEQTVCLDDTRVTTDHGYRESLVE